MKIFKKKQNENKESTHSILLFTFIASTLIVILLFSSFSRSFIDHCIDVKDSIDEAINDQAFIEGKEPKTTMEKINFYKALQNPRNWDYAKYASDFIPKIKEVSKDQDVYQMQSFMFIHFNNDTLRVAPKIDVDGNVAHGVCTLIWMYDSDKKDFSTDIEFYRILENDKIKTYVKTQDGWIVSDGHVLYEDNVMVDIENIINQCLSGEPSFFPIKYYNDKNQFSIPIHPSDTIGITQAGNEFYSTCKDNNELVLLFDENTFLPTMVGLSSHTFYFNKDAMRNNFQHLNDPILEASINRNLYAPWTIYYFDYNDVKVVVPEELKTARKVDSLIEAIPEEILKEIFSNDK